jgi:hypothetical protein
METLAFTIHPKSIEHWPLSVALLSALCYAALFHVCNTVLAMRVPAEDYAHIYGGIVRVALMQTAVLVNAFYVARLCSAPMLCGFVLGGACVFYAFKWVHALNR